MEMYNNSEKLSDYRYDLPEELIAQSPSEHRDESRLMAIDRVSGAISHRRFRDITEYLRSGDVLVVNESKVFPARLIGIRSDTGLPAELLLLDQVPRDGCVWECLMKPGRRGRPGTKLAFGSLTAMVEETKPDGNKIVKFDCEARDFYGLLDGIGKIPLPPYIDPGKAESAVNIRERYQTVYAETIGSSAAPTAGLHFTNELLEKVKSIGVIVVPVTLHVGLGTFRPVKTEIVSEHKMHSEKCVIPEAAACEIRSAKTDGRRIICVGTTSLRTLEGCCAKFGEVREGGFDTDIFIRPGYKFRAADALITNFHLPESTLLMLVSAFWSREKVLDAYEEAIAKKYRFFSFGDAMFLQ
ncbi:S-adenosylmethionine:tRNA ribosyltransferase-isomerase [Clostridia bacterium]|nr:S-adenosylmethionine:tRNA ribosyltransferase-isomerase [Clostridia bacterium]